LKAYQGIRLTSNPELILFPNELVSIAARKLRPVGIWWDILPSYHYLNAELEAVVLPPVRLRRWDELRRNLPGDVLLNASIVDPRLQRCKLDGTTQQDLLSRAARSNIATWKTHPPKYKSNIRKLRTWIWSVTHLIKRAIGRLRSSFACGKQRLIQS
jgi:hypothetical protein